MTRYCYSKLKNTWSSEDRQHTYKNNSYTDPILTLNSTLNSTLTPSPSRIPTLNPTPSPSRIPTLNPTPSPSPSPTPKGLVVFDIDDTLRVVNGVNGDGQWSNCQWRTTHECGFANDTQYDDTQYDDTLNRAANAINTFYDLGYAIAIYTKEQTKDIESSGALGYLKLLASRLYPRNTTKFTQDILVNYQDKTKNYYFGTGSKYGNNKGLGLIQLADKLNIPHNKVLMFDDTNKNIQDITNTKSGICGITVSNTLNICGISEQNLRDGVNFMTYGQCRNPSIPNPSIPKPSKTDKNKTDPSLGVFCAPH
jgi:hypothetical protein